MYERFYQLRERPFALTPDPDYLYPSRVHKEALSYLRYGIEGHAGFVVITGEIGSGKTTLLQTLLRGLDRETTVARLVNTMLDPRELLQAILIDFGLDPEDGKPAMLRSLADFLVGERAAGRVVLLVIDEAQNLSHESLEEVRMLSNLETEKSKLIHIVLVGQPDLRDKLARPELEQLRQRVTVSYHLDPLDADDTEAYINHRLRRAAIGTPLEFPRSVTDFVHRRAGGVPRIINVICDAVLLFGYGDERRVIDLPLAREAIAELEATGVLMPVDDGSRLTVSTRPQSELNDTGQPPARDVELRADVPYDDVVLRQREAEVLRRERQLTEQRRVLEEEYRLLRRPHMTSARSGFDSPVAAWPPAAAYPRPPVAPPAPAGASAASAFSPSFMEIRDSLWQRVRRVFTGPIREGS
jgi:putative secretion ATPase (PEP-CTERM system associated)